MNASIQFVWRAYSALRGALAVVGVVAIAAAYMVHHEQDALAQHLPSFSGVSLLASFVPQATPEEKEPVPTDAPAPSAATVETAFAGSAFSGEQRLLTRFISRRYRVAEEAVARFVSTAYRAGAAYSVDPLLILAVMAVESSYNPVAESSMGAKGLMQVIPRFHMEKLVTHGGADALLDPEVNITVGAQILNEYSRRFGDLRVALQAYAGAFDEPTGQYAGKVFAELARLEALRQRARKQSV